MPAHQLITNTHPVAARLSCAHLGGNALKNLFYVWPEGIK